MPDAIPDDATEIVDAKLNRADLVKSPASGMPVFIFKSSGDPVTDVAKSDAEDILDTAVAAPKLGDERPVVAPGDPDDPDSPAWEAVDAANARAAVNTLVALKELVSRLLSRESLESITGTDPEDSENAYDLDGVLCALDCALGVLAKFAVTEQAEADGRAEDSLLKAAAVLTPDLAEQVLADIAKAGRVLSSTNEKAIRAAVDSLSKVLASLPTAPEADVTKSETVEPVETEPVAKAETADTATATDVVKTGTETTEAEVEPVAKADDTDLSAKSDDDLRRLAITASDTDRQAALQEIGLRALTGQGGAPDPDVTTEVPDDTQDPADVDPNAPDDVTKSTDEPEDRLAELVKAATADIKAEHDSVVKALTDRLTALEESPAAPKVLSNGVTAPVLRGQDAGAPAGQPAELRKAFAETLDPAEQKRLGDEMSVTAYDAIQQIHAARNR